MIADLDTHILIVDDFEVVRREVKLLLKKLGFSNVDTAEDGDEAFRKLREAKNFGLVISDLTMTGMSGLDLLKSIRADAELSKVRFIMVTGHSESQNVMAAKNAGVNGYIVKPFNIVALKDRIQTVLGALPPPPAAITSLRA